MKFQPTDLPGVIVVEPDVHRDPRGLLVETYHQRKYQEGGIGATFVQDNYSRSSRGTLRGLHAQLRQPQGKLVRVVDGEVFDVAVDVRRGSPTFGRWYAERLSGENHRQVYVPPGFAHGFCVVSEWAAFAYKCTDFYDPADEFTIRWDDPDLAIPWPVEDPQLSRKDEAAPPLRDLIDRLPVFTPPAD